MLFFNLEEIQVNGYDYTPSTHKEKQPKFMLIVTLRESDPKMRVPDSSASQIFFKKNMMMQHYWAQKPAAKF